MPEDEGRASRDIARATAAWKEIKENLGYEFGQEFSPVSIEGKLPGPVIDVQPYAEGLSLVFEKMVGRRMEMDSTKRDVIRKLCSSVLRGLASTKYALRAHEFFTQNAILEEVGEAIEGAIAQDIVPMVRKLLKIDEDVVNGTAADRVLKENGGATDG